MCACGDGKIHIVIDGKVLQQSLLKRKRAEDDRPGSDAPNDED